MSGFLHNEVLTSTVMASLATRSKPVYRAKQCEESPGSYSKKRILFKSDLKRTLSEIARDYLHPVCDESHLINIQYLSSEMEARHKCLLEDEIFRLGVSQKALNLFLKYEWMRGVIAKPPHCPFDSIILAELRDDVLEHEDECLHWTTMNCVDCYRRWVKAARKKVQECWVCDSISDWENCVWRRNQTKGRKLSQIRRNQ